jgi:tetratricopeptide (TPR) repeat protein
MMDSFKAKKAFDEGAAAFLREDYSDGLRHFSKAIQHDPEMTVAYVSRGVLHLKHERWRNAISDFNRVIELDPSDARARYYRGLAYDRLGHTARAYRDFDRALEIDPDLTDAYRSRNCLVGKKCEEDPLKSDLGMINLLTAIRVTQFLEPETVRGVGA